MEIDPSTLDRKAAYHLMISAIAPRPIALVTSMSAAGVVNMAPFSYFNGVSSTPPIVSIAIGSKKTGRKDTWRNIEETGEFVVNVVTPELMDGVITGAKEHPPEVSELELSKLTPMPSRKVKVPGVAESPVQMECERYKIVDIEGGGALILGRVVHWRIRDGLVKDGRVDPSLVTFVGRLGGELYCRVNDIFKPGRE